MPAKIRTIWGRVREVLNTQPECSFDACLCDPPYALTANKRGGSGTASVNLDSPYGRARIGTGNGAGGFMGQKWDSEIPGPAVWAEVLRVLKPGAFLLAFGGTRTHHRLMVAIEDAGFEIRDCMMWLYGSGFPKSLDISKALDRRAKIERAIVGKRRDAFGDAEQSETEDGRNLWGKPSSKTVVLRSPAPATPEAARWSGYGTALKPAWEPIIVAMKPCDGTFAENALKHGVAGINIDAGRIEYEPGGTLASNPSLRTHINGGNGGRVLATEKARRIGVPSGLGRWPANVILDEEAGRLLDQQSGITTSGAMRTDIGAYERKERQATTFLRGRSGPTNQHPDSGGASRFFYCAKASRRERGEGNTHPTVKPLKLTEYLARLILPPERDTPRRLLIPFAGSGSEMIGAHRAGWDEIVGIEIDPGYLRIARNRLTAAAHP